MPAGSGIEEKMTEPTDRDLTAAVEYAKHVRSAYLQHEQFLKDYGSQTLKTLLTLNGGAILAILAMVSSFANKTGQMIIEPRSLVPALLCYLCGLIFVILGTAMGYFNFQHNAHVHATPFDLANRIAVSGGNWPSDWSEQRVKNIVWSANAAILSVICSGTLFGIGSFLLALMFLNLHHTPTAWELFLQIISQHLLLFSH